MLPIGTHQSVYRDWPAGKLEERSTLVERLKVLAIFPHQQGTLNKEIGLKLIEIASYKTGIVKLHYIL